MHACVRSSLRSAFRLTAKDFAAVSFPTFLAPAFRAKTPARHYTTPKSEKYFDNGAQKIRTSSVGFVPLPYPEARGKLDEWIRLLDSALPRELRQEPGTQYTPDRPIRNVYAIIWLTISRAYQNTGIDLLEYLGTTLGRWDAVDWIIRTVINDETRPVEPLASEHPLFSFTPGPLTTLDDFTDLHPAAKDLPTLHAQEAYLTDVSGQQLIRKSEAQQQGWMDFPGQTEKHTVPLEDLNPAQLRHSQTMEELTQSPLLIDSSPRQRIRHRLLGRVWGTLGHMILTASERSPEESESIMTHVLRYIALFQERGLVPAKTYQRSERNDAVSLQQPHLLDLYSSTIYIALSDITQSATLFSGTLQKDHDPPVWNFLDTSHLRLPTPNIAPEIWLEMVLWSCVHGGFVVEAVGVLNRLSSMSWSVLSWGKVLPSVLAVSSWQGKDALKEIGNAFKNDGVLSSQKVNIQHKVSSEVVSAFVQGLVSSIHIGVGLRGVKVRHLLGHLSSLKDLLEKENLPLVGSTWDSVIARIVSDGGIDVERDPESMMQILSLVGSIDGHPPSTRQLLPTIGEARSEQPFPPDPSSVILGQMHRTLRAFIGLSDFRGAFRSLEQIQSYVDSRKYQVVLDFFAQKNIGDRDSTMEEAEEEKQPLDSKVHPKMPLNTSTQIPAQIMAGFIDLTTKYQAYELVDWLLNATDFDGPMIPKNLYKEPLLSGALITYAHHTNQKELVNEILRSSVERQVAETMPVHLLLALVCGQIERRRWESVRNILTRLEMQNSGSSEDAWRPRTLVVLAKEIIRHNLREMGNKASLEEAQSIFLDLMRNGFRRDDGPHGQLNAILGILSSISPSYKNLAAGISTRRLRHRIATREALELTLSTRDFDVILSAIAEVYGSFAAFRTWDKWCARLDWRHEHFVRRGDGVRPMSRVSPIMTAVAAQRYNVVGSHGSYSQNSYDSPTPVTFRGHIVPNLSTIKVVLDSIRSEIQRGADDAEAPALVKWALDMMQDMGLPSEDALRECQGLYQVLRLAKSETKMLGDGDIEVDVEADAE